MGMSTEEELVRLLKRKRIEIPDFSESETLVRFLWTLKTVKDNTETRRITTKAASYIFYELTEIELKENSINKAISRSADKTKVSESDNKKYYEITDIGRRFIETKITDISPNKTFFFTGNSSWSDLNEKFPKLIEILDGDLRIVDPFYGIGTLNVLSKFGNKRKIKFISGELGRKEQKNPTDFSIELGRFNGQFKNIEMRKYEDYDEIHDRYIIAKNGLVVIGHGIKDLGNKESFVIFLPIEKVKNLSEELVKIFDERWKKSQIIL